jgi:hypothetical protein
MAAFVRVAFAVYAVAFANHGFAADPDLKTILFQKGDFHASWEAGKFESKPPEMFDDLPPTKQRGFVPLTVNNKRRGGLAGFVYQSADDAADAYEIIVMGLGPGTKAVSDLGELSRQQYIDRHFFGRNFQATDIVFARGNAVVHIRLADLRPEEVISIARKIDARFKNAFPDSGIDNQKWWWYSFP